MRSIGGQVRRGVTIVIGWDLLLILEKNVSIPTKKMNRSLWNMSDGLKGYLWGSAVGGTLVYLLLGMPLAAIGYAGFSALAYYLIRKFQLHAKND